MAARAEDRTVIVRRWPKVVVRLAFLAAALGIGIELLGFGAYLARFPFPEVADAIRRPEWLEFLAFIFWFFWLPAALLAMLVLLLATVIELVSSRGSPGRWVALGAAHVAIVAGMFVLDRLDNPDRAVRRSGAVVEAIRRYEADHGNPPPDLESLVPGYLRELPNTWCPSYRGWEYVALELDPVSPKYPGSNRTWELSIDCRKEGLFEDLRYHPEGERSTGNVPEHRRIGDWIYWRD